MKEIIKIEHLHKTYDTGAVQVHALRDVNLTITEGEYVAIMGESGSGKTTLLNILASLDKPTSGEVLLRENRITSIKEAEIARFRREHLGFVFQDFNLLDNFSVEDNILLPLVLAGHKYGEMQERLREITEVLGIGDLIRKYPYEISGGQKQRVAVARATITRPDIILADEPTGALDSKSTGDLLRVFDALNRRGQTILMVTHSVRAASNANRILFIKDGEIYHQIYRGNMDNNELYKKVSDTLTVLLSGGGQHE